jgi:2-polyprenyl-3-methyl-5-hydroxy-6-metoxy-1,4-benzoquinol methylase
VTSSARSSVRPGEPVNDGSAPRIGNAADGGRAARAYGPPDDPSEGGDMIETTTARSAGAKIYELADLIGAAATIMGAADSGLLAALVQGSGTSAELAGRVGLDARAADVVLGVLASQGLASLDGDVYAASPGLLGIGERFPGGVPWVASLWSHLPTFLATGEPFGPFDGNLEERERSYVVAAEALERLFGPAAAELAVRLPGAPARILDVGAGSGVWSLSMAERCGAVVTTFDLPGVADLFLSRAAARGLGDRADALVGDFNATELPAEAFDRVVLANVIHLEPPARARALIARAAAAVAPGGDLVVIEPIGRETPARERAAALYALHLAMRTREGWAHRQPEITEWLRDAGLAIEAPVELEGPPSAFLGIVGRRPA